MYNLFDMSQKKIKQHWLPKMHIKQWLNDEDELHYFSLNDVDFKFSKYSRSNKRFQYDPFIIDEMYEREGSEFNSTENKLAWIESSFKEVQDKIIKQSNNNNIKLTRRDIEILKTFIFTMKIRNKSLFERFKNLDGDYLFKLKYQDMTVEERNKILYETIDLYIDTQIKRLDEDINNPSDELKKMTRRIMADPITSIASNQNTSIKIFRSKSENFLLTDQFGSSIINPVPPGGFLIGFYPITPDICIGLLNENGIIRSCNKMESYLFGPGKDYICNYFNWNRDKFFRFDGIPSYKSDKYSFDDIFTYKNNFLSDQETAIINAYLTTQSSDIIAYKNRLELHNAFEAEKTFQIYRGEDDFRDSDDGFDFEDIYGNKPTDDALKFAAYSTIDSLINMFKWNYHDFLFQINGEATGEDLIEIITSNMHSPNYNDISQKLMKLIYTKKNLIKDQVGNYALSDKMLKDPEMSILIQTSFLWNDIFQKYARGKFLEKFKFIGSDSTEQGKLNGPDWVFEYDDGFKLGVEITSNIYPIFTGVGNTTKSDDELSRIANSIVEKNGFNLNDVMIEWRKNRLDDTKMDLFIKRRFNNDGYDIFEKMVIEKIDKSEKYQKTDKLVILFNSSSFDISDVESENDTFNNIKKKINKMLSEKYDDKISIEIL